MYREEAVRLASRAYRNEYHLCEGVWWGTTEELSGCWGTGDTVEECKADVFEARVMWIEHCLEYGIRVPEPGEEWTWDGKVATKKPQST
jgi:predicted RNase H-like HicB family nuclease